MSNCGGELVNGWCPRCGGGHESDEEMATRRELLVKNLRLLDRIRGNERKTNN